MNKSVKNEEKKSKPMIFGLQANKPKSSNDDKIKNKEKGDSK